VGLTWLVPGGVGDVAFDERLPRTSKTPEEADE
jgi:hypothetical protein